MERGEKRKKDASVSSESARKCLCVVHFKNIEHGSFTYLSETQDPEQRLKRLQEIRAQRLTQPIGSVHRMEEICSLIPSEYSEEHGYHRPCFQKFTMNLNRLKIPVSDLEQTSTSGVTQRRRLSTESDRVLFKPDCIFCNKEGKQSVKVKGIWTSETTSKFECGGGRNILEIAEKREDEVLLTRIRGFDSFACEAHYHRSCQKDYTRDPTKWRSTNEQEKTKQEGLQEAHRQAFSAVCQQIDQEILKEKDILKLSDLLEVYKTALQETQYPNPNYRGENLKAKLETSEFYKEKLAFSPLFNKGKFPTYLVYSSHIDVGSAIRCAYELGTKDLVIEVAGFLRKVILEAFQNSEALPWPPSAKYLENIDNVVPLEVQNFLTFVISGKSISEVPRVNRLVNSIGQDICRAATSGQWKLPKHILICMTLRHLFRSAELTSLINRLGHSESYSFSLELETAIASAIQETSRLLSAQIIRNPSAPSLFHSDFDNFDQLVNQLTGKGSIHTAHGIMLQEISGNPDDQGQAPLEVPSTVKTRERSLKLPPVETLPDCFITKRKSPSYDITQRIYPGSVEAMKDAHLINLLWFFVRVISSLDEQQVPGWAGFVSLTGLTPTNMTTIDYYPVINHPITDYSTVQECLRYSAEASKEVGQDYVITSFDLGVCMKAYPLVWNYPEKYKNHIVMIGTFHVICAYFKMIGKKMNGSGFSDVLLEAGLISSGSLQGVLSGKHYTRAMHCHKVMLESLERLLLEMFLSKRVEEQLV